MFQLVGSLPGPGYSPHFEPSSLPLALTTPQCSLTSIYPDILLLLLCTLFCRCVFLSPVEPAHTTAMSLAVESQTLAPLPDVLSHGLVAVSTFGLLSFFCSSSLFFYLTWRLISWRSKSDSKTPPNQFLILIYNLLLADIQQALAFLLNISALRNNGIYVGTSTCFAQGWFVSTGDLASSVFICAIAIHTWMGVVKEYRLPTPAFYCCIGALWTFVYLMAAIGPIIHGHDFYVRASAWVCSQSPHSII